MADWPRAISPENRIKYLVQARHDFKEDTQWSLIEGRHTAATADGEYLEITKSPDGYEGTCSVDGHIEYEGTFQSAQEARKALVDHVVVKWAVLQAWEDVAS